jgi:hypothetical protein
MGKIMLNGKQYGVGGLNNAEDVSYDNTSSGMTATNVQDAVDELNTGLTFKKILNNVAVSNTSFTLSDSIENYSEVVIFLRTNNYRMTTLSIPVDSIISAGYSSENQYIVDMVASVTVNYMAYIQVAFTSATTLRITGNDMKGWTGTMYMDVYAR